MKGTHASRFASMMVAVAMLVSAVGVRAAEEEAAAEDPALKLYFGANALCARRLYEPAITQYEAFLKQNPKHAKAPLAEWGLAISYYSIEKFDKAEPLFTKLAESPLIKDQEQLHNLLGSCLLALNKPAEAEKALLWTVQNAKKAGFKVDAMAALAEAYFRQSKWKELAALSEDLLKTAPDSPYTSEVRYQGAVALSNLKQYEPSSVAFAALAKDSKDPSLVHRATFQLAECQHRMGKLAEAAVSYDAAAKTKPGDYSEYAQYNLGMVRFLLKEYAPAITELTAFIQKYDKSTMLPQAKLYLGRAYLEAANFAAAEATLPALAADKAVGNQATLWLARTYARQQKYANIETLVTPALTTFAQDAILPELEYELATAQMNLKKFAEAAANYGKALAAAKEGPLAVESLRLQAFCLHSAAQYADSLKLCEAFLTQNLKHPETAEVMFLKAENLTLLKQADAAMPVYEAVVAADPKHKRASVALLRMAQAYYQKEDWKNCLAKVTPLLTATLTEPVFDQVWYMAGACEFRLGNVDKAIPAFEKFIKDKPAQPNVDTALYNLALACQRKSQPEKAIAALSDLVTRFPQSGRLADALVELGRLQYEAKQYAAARVTLAKVPATGPADAQYYLGWVALSENKDAEAMQCFAAMLKAPKHPFAADAALQLAILQVRAKQYKEAQATLTGLLTSYKDYGKRDQATFYLGFALAQQEQNALAVEQFASLPKDHPKSDKLDKALYWQAWCQKMAKNATEAMKLYAAFLTAYPTSDLANDVTVELSELEFEAQIAREKAGAAPAPAVKPPAAAAPAAVAAPDAKTVYETILKRLNVLLAPEKKLADGSLRNRALYLVGWCHFKTDDMSKSAVAFETMLGSKEPGALAASAYFQAGEARMKIREYEPARLHFTKAVAAGKGPQHEPGLLRRAQTEALVNQWAASQASATEFLTAYPQSKFKVQAQFALAWALENQKQYDPAIAAYREVTKAGGADEIAARSQFQIGECLFAQSKLDDAIPELILVESTYNAYPEWVSKALLEMGRVLEAQKKKGEAAERYKEVMTRFPKTAAAEVAENLLKKLSGS